MLGAFGRAEAPFPARDAAHGVRFIKQDNTVKIFACPGKDLLQPAVIAGLRAQCWIRDEQHALGERDRFAGFPVGQRLDVEVDAAECRPIAPCIFKQRVVLGNPDVPLFIPQPLIKNNARELAALTCPSAITEEKSLDVALALRVRYKLKTFFWRDVSPWQILIGGVACIDNCLKLRGAEHAVADDMRWKLRDIARDWHSD